MHAVAGTDAHGPTAGPVCVQAISSGRAGNERGVSCSFFAVFWGGHRASPAAPPLALYDSAAAPDSRRADTLLAALDIDAAINAHERWKDRLMDYLEGRTSVRLDPAQVRRADQSALAR